MASSLAAVDLAVMVVAVELGMVRSLVGLVDGGLESRDDLAGRHHVVDQSLETVLENQVDLGSRCSVVETLAAGCLGSPSGWMGNQVDLANLADC